MGKTRSKSGARKESFLQLHERLLRDGLCDKRKGYEGGLCNVKFRGELLEDNEIFKEISSEVPYSWRVSYWGYSDKDGFEYTLVAGEPSPIRYEYTPLRQTIVLLCAALAREL